MKSVCSVTIAFCVLIYSLGCSHTIRQGADVQTLQNFNIEKGKTTRDEVVAHLGPPMSTMTQSDGTELLTWSGVQGRSHDSTLLALVPFAIGAAHANVNAQSCSLQITVKNGIVTDFVRTDSNQNTKL